MFFKAFTDDSTKKNPTKKHCSGQTSPVLSTLWVRHWRWKRWPQRVSSVLLSGHIQVLIPPFPRKILKQRGGINTCRLAIIISWWRRKGVWGAKPPRIFLAIFVRHSPENTFIIAHFGCNFQELFAQIPFFSRLRRAGPIVHELLSKSPS